ncbi:unnamed protein product [Arabidopsis halleri]
MYFLLQPWSRKCNLCYVLFVFGWRMGFLFFGLFLFYHLIHDSGFVTFIYLLVESTFYADDAGDMISLFWFLVG